MVIFDRFRPIYCKFIDCFPMNFLTFQFTLDQFQSCLDPIWTLQLHLRSSFKEFGPFQSIFEPLGGQFRLNLTKRWPTLCILTPIAPHFQPIRMNLSRSPTDFTRCRPFSNLQCTDFWSFQLFADQFQPRLHPTSKNLFRKRCAQSESDDHENEVNESEIPFYFLRIFLRLIFPPFSFLWL